jgi:putative DNA primase/helicase
VAAPETDDVSTITGETKPVTLEPRFESIPPELTAQHQFVLWRWAWLPPEKDKPGHWTKEPYQVNGRLASSTARSTWAPFEDVMIAYEGGAFDGIGFALDPTAIALVAIDLDKVVDLDSGVIHAEALRIAREIHSYTERSPSGLGLRILARGALPAGWRNTKKYTVPIEMYSEGRYVTITGHRLQWDA